MRALWLEVLAMKLRAYDTVEKRYVHIESIQFDHLGGGEPFTLTTGGKTWAVARFVLEQFTGLKDKNGREIYEGDIVKSAAPWVTTPDVVKWDHEYFGWLPFVAVNDYGIQDGGNMVIIGNVHENPELLEGGSFSNEATARRNEAVRDKWIDGGKK